MDTDRNMAGGEIDWDSRAQIDSFIDGFASTMSKIEKAEEKRIAHEKELVEKLSKVKAENVKFKNMLEVFIGNSNGDMTFEELKAERENLQSECDTLKGEKQNILEDIKLLHRLREEFRAKIRKDGEDFLAKAKAFESDNLL